MLSTTIISSGAFAYNTQQDEKIKNFIEDHISEADKLTLSDVKKALPFMSDMEAKKFLLNMQNFFIEHKKNASRILE